MKRIKMGKVLDWDQKPIEIKPDARCLKCEAACEKCKDAPHVQRLLEMRNVFLQHLAMQDTSKAKDGIQWAVGLKIGIKISEACKDGAEGEVVLEDAHVAFLKSALDKPLFNFLVQARAHECIDNALEVDVERGT